jgi:hypothetical protein
VSTLSLKSFVVGDLVVGLLVGDTEGLTGVTVGPEVVGVDMVGASVVGDPVVGQVVVRGYQVSRLVWRL